MTFQTVRHSWSLSYGSVVKYYIDCNLTYQTREITDKFTVEVEMDRRCYEELLGERKNMELTYEDRISQLQDQHAEVGDYSKSLHLMI